MTWYCVSDQIRSVAQSCLTLWDPMNRSTPGLPVPHQLPVYKVANADLSPTPCHISPIGLGASYIWFPFWNVVMQIKLPWQVPASHVNCTHRFQSSECTNNWVHYKYYENLWLQNLAISVRTRIILIKQSFVFLPCNFWGSSSQLWASKHKYRLF